MASRLQTKDCVSRWSGYTLCRRTWVCHSQLDTRSLWQSVSPWSHRQSRSPSHSVCRRCPSVSMIVAVNLTHTQGSPPHLVQHVHPVCHTPAVSLSISQSLLAIILCQSIAHIDFPQPFWHRSATLSISISRGVRPADHNCKVSRRRVSDSMGGRARL